MQISTPSTLGRIAPPPPSVVDTAAAEPAGSGFASLLQQQPEPAPTDAATGERDDTPTSARRETRPRAPARAAAPRPTERPATPDAGARPESTDDTTAAASAEKAGDPGLLDWLAALQLPAPVASAATGAEPATLPVADAALANPAAPPFDGLAGAPRLAADSGADAGAALQGVNAARAGARDKAATSPRGASAALEAASAAAPTRAAAEPGEAARFTVDAPTILRSSPAPENTAPAAALAPAPAAPQTAAPAAAVAVPLATPLDDPQFPRAFGVQVSVLARDGVQQAELHLNPAEMGPVSVQIVLDGTQARIDFGADAAGTRQLIEHSLPDLAAALREAGLTLSGGGVSQHASSGRDRNDGQAPAEPGSPAAAGAETAPAATRRSVRAGGVDLYA